MGASVVRSGRPAESKQKAAVPAPSVTPLGNGLMAPLGAVSGELQLQVALFGVTQILKAPVKST